MRFGCCGSMITQYPDKTGADAAGVLKEAGYDYIELSLAHISSLDEFEFCRLKEKLLGSGIACEACNNLFPPGLKLTGPEADMPQAARYAEAALQRAGRLGARIVVFGSGKAKWVPGGFSMDKAWEQLVCLTRKLGRLAGEYGVAIAVEPLRKQECNIVNTVSEGLKLCWEADDPAVGILADFYHISSEGEAPSILSKAGGLLKHVHLARVSGRAFPADIGEDDYTPFISSLNEIHYNDRISIEAYTSDFPTDAAAALSLLKTSFDKT